MPPSSSGIRGNPAITKPFGTMTIDELLVTLPACAGDPPTINQHWLPAMHAEMAKVINLLNEVTDLQIGRDANQVTLSNVSVAIFRACSLAFLTSTRP